MDKAREALGLQGRLFHDLRRTGARDMRKSGTSEGVIMALGNWKTRSVFERYNIKDAADLHEAAARRNAMIAGNGK
jgi:integrase